MIDFYIGFDPSKKIDYFPISFYLLSDLLLDSVFVSFSRFRLFYRTRVLSKSIRVALARVFVFPIVVTASHFLPWFVFTYAVV